ncbi:response regulator transcription factor [Parasalinivibrio latis]|uniref:response regulator transcription factor n=1 Tax=Parasalinivibrio latis TaxID=2952610 RepID=UPI0030DEDCA3
MYKEYFARNKPRVLLKENEPGGFTSILKGRLEEVGCRVSTVAPGGAISHDCLATSLLITQIQAGEKGESMLRWLCTQGPCPVLALVDGGCSQARVSALSMGAEDVVSSPFDLEECMLRAFAILRRDISASNPDQETCVLRVDDLVLDRTSDLVEVGQQDVSLTPTQFRLLWTLVSHQDRTLSKSYLYQMVLKKHFSPDDRSLDMHLSRVRRKLASAGFSSERLQTDHGRGYRFT